MGKHKTELSLDTVSAFLNNLKIESGNEMPKGVKTSAYADFLNKLEVNQNVYFDDPDFVQRLYSSAMSYGKKHDKSFSLKSEVINGKKRWGLWRIK